MAKTSRTIFTTIEEEINSFLDREIEIAEGVHFSQHKLIRRIMKYKNRNYYKTKLTKQARYKFGFDIIHPRVGDEVKNIDIDTNNIVCYSETQQVDFPAVFITNLKLKEWMRDNNQGDLLNETVEMFSSDGNVVFKKTKKGYDLYDPLNFYVINQTAKTLHDTPVIERHELTQTELRKMKGVWDADAVDSVIKDCKEKSHSTTERTSDISTTNPIYEIFERNGEVSEAELFEAQGREGGEEEKYVLAKIIVAGIKTGTKDHKYVLYADIIKSMDDVYEEAHRGPYKGRWWREGLYELLLDHQVRANEIGNQLARGLEWSSKTIFRSADKLTAQNILTDLEDGNIIRSSDIQQVPVRMQGLDQLIADWNRLMEDADRVANSHEIIRGETRAGTPFKLGALMDTNAGKLFVVLRQRLTVPYKRVFKKWIIPLLIKDLKVQDIISVSGDEGMVQQFKGMMVEQWYVRNLHRIGPHTMEMSQLLKEAKAREIDQQELSIQNMKEIWDGIIKRLNITITGENFDMQGDIQTLSSLLQVEHQPEIRRALLDKIMELKGIVLKVEAPQEAETPQQVTDRDVEGIAGGQDPAIRGGE